MSVLADAALELSNRFGWTIVPVRQKKPRVPWRPTLNPSDTARLFHDPATTGIAAVLGDRSRGLVCRDFDDNQAFERWRERHPIPARTLPIAGTARGAHVYATIPGATTFKLADGEFRGEGGIVVLPPSLHPSGSPYEWLNPPTSEPPEVDFADLDAELPPAFPHLQSALTEPYLQSSTPQEVTHDVFWGGGCASNPFLSCVTPFAEAVQELLADAIRRTRPQRVGERNDRLFDFARELHGIFGPSLTDAQLKALARNWHRNALGRIGTLDPRTTEQDLVRQYRCVRFPAGATLARALEIAESDPFTATGSSVAADRLARLLRALHTLHQGRPFHLDYRHASKLIGFSVKTAHQSAGRLESLGYILRTDRGRPGVRSRIATTWSWTGP